MYTQGEQHVRLKADRDWGDAAEAEECQQSFRYRREHATDSPSHLPEEATTFFLGFYATEL